MAQGHSNRNYCLDFVKGIACICVVFMHCEFPGKLGILVQCVARFCVPYFFMVSGYFSYYKDGRKFPAQRKIKHIFTIVAAVSIFYLMFGLFQKVFMDVGFTVSAKDIIYFALLNKPIIIVSQMWFLFALLYVYIIYAIVDKMKLQRIAYYMVPVLIGMYIILAQGMHLMGFSIQNPVYRNFLIEGFPLFMLGHLIHKNEEKLTERFSNKLLLTLIGTCTVLCIVERYILGRDFGINICTFPQVAAIFLFAVKNRNIGEKNILTKLGTRYSMFVYILHPFVWHSFEYIYLKAGISQNNAALYLMPVIVLSVTIVLSVIVEKTIGILNRNKEKVKA